MGYNSENEEVCSEQHIYQILVDETEDEIYSKQYKAAIHWKHHCVFVSHHLNFFCLSGLLLFIYMCNAFKRTNNYWKQGHEKQAAICNSHALVTGLKPSGCIGRVSS